MLSELVVCIPVQLSCCGGEAVPAPPQLVAYRLAENTRELIREPLLDLRECEAATGIPDRNSI